MRFIKGVRDHGPTFGPSCTEIGQNYRFEVDFQKNYIKSSCCFGEIFHFEKIDL